MKRRFRGLKLSFAVVGLFFIALSYILHSPRFHDFLLSMIRNRSGWSLSIENSDLQLLRGRLNLYGLDLQDPSAKLRVTTDSLKIQVSPISLIRGKLILTHLDVDHPVLFLEKKDPVKPIDPERVFQALDRSFSAFEKSLFLQNSILDKILLKDLSLQFSDGRAFGLRQVQLHIEPNLLREIQCNLHLEEISGLRTPWDSFDLSLLLKRHGMKLKGLSLVSPKLKLALAGEWKGTLTKGSLKLISSLEAPTVLSDPLSVTLASKVEKNVFTIEKLSAFLNQASLEGHGTFKLSDLSYDIPFVAKNLPLESILGKIPGPVVGPAKGIGHVEGRAIGRLPKLVVKSRSKITDFRHTVLAAREASGTLDLDWPSLDFDADVRPGNDSRIQATVKGGVLFKRLAEKEKLQAMLKTLDLKIEGGSLQDIIPTLKISGNIHANLRLQGAPGIANDTSVQGTGHAEVKEAHWFLGPVNSLITDVSFRPGGKIGFTKTTMMLPNLAPILWPREVALNTSGESVTFSGQPAEGVSFRGYYQKTSGVFRLESFQLRKSPSSLEGTLTLSPGGHSEGRIKGTLNLAWLSYFPAFFRDGRGISRLDLSFSGPLKDPIFRGQINFPDETSNEIILRGFRYELTGLEGSVTMDGSHISPKIYGLLGDGRFHLTGRMGMSHWKPEMFDLVFQGHDLNVSRHDVYRINFDTNFTLKGQAPSPRLEGKIDILDGRYLKPFIVSERFLRPAYVEREPSLWEQSLDQVPLNLQVRNSGDMKIQNNVATVIMQSDLHVGGTYGQPVYSGSLSVIEGVIHYLNSDFLLNEGRLDFRSGASEPYLKVIAQQDIPPDYVVSIELKGPLSNLEVGLSSSPSLSRQDILSLIASGLTQEEIRRGGRSRNALGAGILAGEISSVLERPLAKTTGMDVFRLEASPSGKLSVLSVGKNLTDRMSVEFQNDLAPETAQRTIQANYYLTDNILLKGFRSRSAGENPKYQFNVSFRFRLN